MNKNIWDFWAKYYDRLWVQHVSLKPTRTEIIRNIIPKKNLKLLDIGCGTGQLLGDIRLNFADHEIDYTGVDQSGEMINEARQKFPSDNFIESDVSDYIKTEEQFDIIVCSHAFPYFPDKQEVLNGFKKMLKTGGTLLLTQASVNSIYDTIILSFVKLTTSRAEYPGIKEMERLSAQVFKNPPEIIPVGRFFVPSICMFKWVKE